MATPSSTLTAPGDQRLLMHAKVDDDDDDVLGCMRIVEFFCYNILRKRRQDPRERKILWGHQVFVERERETLPDWEITLARLGQIVRMILCWSELGARESNYHYGLFFWLDKSLASFSREKCAFWCDSSSAFDGAGERERGDEDCSRRRRRRTVFSEAYLRWRPEAVRLRAS